MGFLSKLFKKKSVNIVVKPTSRTIENPECIKLLALKAYMNSLLSDNRYISKSEYRTKLLDEKNIVEYFAALNLYIGTIVRFRRYFISCNDGRIYYLLSRKIVGSIYDNRFLIKTMPISVILMPNAPKNSHTKV